MKIQTMKCVLHHLLPGVQSQCSDADLFDLIFSGPEQQVPVRSGGQRDLQREACAFSDFCNGNRITLGKAVIVTLTCRARAARKIQAQAMVSAWNLTKTLVLRLSFM